VVARNRGWDDSVISQRIGPVGNREGNAPGLSDESASAADADGGGGRSRHRPV
jgi:hypothetical protein